MKMLATQITHGLKIGRREAAKPATVISLVAVMLTVLPYVSPSVSLVLAGLLIAIIAFVRFDPLLYVMVFLMPVAPLISVGDFPIHDVAGLARLALFAGVLARKLAQGEPIMAWLAGGLFQKINLLYCAIAVVSATVVNPLELGAAQSLFRLASYVALFYAVTGWVRSESQLRKVMGALFASTIAVCLLGFAQVVIDDPGPWHDALYGKLAQEYSEPWTGRITSVFNRTNPLAGYLDLVLPLSLLTYGCPSLPKSLRVAGRACFVVGAVALVLTESRGGLLGFVPMVFIVLRFFVRTRKARWTAVLDAVLALAIGAITSYVAVQVATPPSGASAASDRFEGLDEGTLVRLFIYASAWGMFVSAPFFGIGFGNFRSHLNPLMGEDSPNNVWDTHNLYLKLLSETGMLGFVCFLALILVVVLMALKSRKKASHQMDYVFGGAVLGAVTTLMLHGTVEVNMEVPQFGAMLWMLFGLFVAARRLNQPDAPGSNADRPATSRKGSS